MYRARSCSDVGKYSFEEGKARENRLKVGINDIGCRIWELKIHWDFKIAIWNALLVNCYPLKAN